MKYQPKLEKDPMCPVEHGLDIFGGKWKARIICVLSSQKFMRYNELKRELNNITDAVLAAMLKELVENNIVSRIQYNEIPPRVEYSLTDTGKSVLPILESICKWSREHSKEELEKKLPTCRSCPHL
jgi:transcriptional regulator, hxlR family protein